jgi:hypothetical protein
MEQPNSKFKTMGTSAAKGVTAPSAKPLKGKLVPRKNTAAGDPYAQAKPSRTNVKATSAKQYGITTKMPAYKDPQIGPTQGNGRILKPSTNRTSVDFADGMSNYN